MHLLSVHPCSNLNISQTPSLSPNFSPPRFSIYAISPHPFTLRRRGNKNGSFFFPISLDFSNPRALGEIKAQISNDEESPKETKELLGRDGVVFHETLRLVECAMLAAVAGLAYFLSNSLAIEVATAMLLLTLSGPVKACTYLLMHGFVGLAMGSLWRLGANWSLSIVLCALVRALGAMGYVLISSFLIRENILALITINIHASLTYVLAAIGVNIIPSMEAIYAIFGTLLLLNCGFFVFLLHILYAVFLSRLGMKVSLSLPSWLQKAI